jgi:hypothetical protein
VGGALPFASEGLRPKSGLSGAGRISIAIGGTVELGNTFPGSGDILFSYSFDQV